MFRQVRDFINLEKMKALIVQLTASLEQYKEYACEFKYHLCNTEIDVEASGLFSRFISASPYAQIHLDGVSMEYSQDNLQAIVKNQTLQSVLLSNILHFNHVLENLIHALPGSNVNNLELINCQRDEQTFILLTQLINAKTNLKSLSFSWPMQEMSPELISNFLLALASNKTLESLQIPDLNEVFEKALFDDMSKEAYLREFNGKKTACVGLGCK